MKKLILLSAVLILSLSLVACQEVSEKWSENMQLAMEAFGESLGAFAELDANSSDAARQEVIDEMDASWAEVKVVAEAEGVDISLLEEAMDELERAIRASGGEPLEAQKGFLSAWFDAMSEFFSLLAG